MQLKPDSVTLAGLEKAARQRGISPEQLAEQLLERKYKHGVTDLPHATIYDTSFDNWQSRFDSEENRADMVINIRMSDQAGVALTNAARQAKSTPEALVLKLIEEKWGSKSDSASDSNLRTRVHLDLLKTQEATAYEQYVERLRSSSRR